MSDDPCQCEAVREDLQQEIYANETRIAALAQRVTMLEEIDRRRRDEMLNELRDLDRKLRDELTPSAGF